MLTRPFRMATAYRLPNGALILQRRWHETGRWFAMGQWEKNGHTEYVTWVANDSGECYWGHYFSNPDIAAQDFIVRYNRGF